MVNGTDREGEPHGASPAEAEEEQLVLADEAERLPWLESDDEYDDEGVDTARLVIAGVVGLLVVLAVLAVGYWVSRPEPGDDLLAEGETIEAPDEPYRTRPEDPGGTEVAGTGDLSFEVGEGHSVESRLARDESASEAAAAPRPSIDREQAAAEALEPAASAPETPEASGVPIQVAAYSSRARAEQGWGELSRRYEALQGLSHRVVQASVDGATVYRLQALAGTVDTASSVCRAVRAAGGDCQVIR